MAFARVSDRPLSQYPNGGPGFRCLQAELAGAHNLPNDDTSLVQSHHFLRHVCGRHTMAQARLRPAARTAAILLSCLAVSSAAAVVPPMRVETPAQCAERAAAESASAVRQARAAFDAGLQALQADLDAAVALASTEQRAAEAECRRKDAGMPPASASRHLPDLLNRTARGTRRAAARVRWTL